MYNEDIEIAKKARLNARSPYNKFTVGATLKTKNGKLYSGCNIDNIGIQSICAERVAFVKALSDGEREFERITIVGAPINEEPNEECVPCGYCRQFMREYVDDDFKICTVDKNNNIKEYTIKDLLPHDFNL